MADGFTVLCVAGQMASGKNAATSILEQMQFACIDADQVIHKAADDAEQEILSAFSKEAEKAGIAIVAQDGRLDRRALGQLIFPHPALLQKQEEIVYPIFINYIEDFLNESSKESGRFRGAVINAAVLYKIPSLMKKCKAIIYIEAPFFKRLIRAKKRDHMKTAQIIARFKSQRTMFKEYKKTGTPIIRISNSGSLANLSNKIRLALNHLF